MCVCVCVLLCFAISCKVLSIKNTALFIIKHTFKCLD